MVAVLVCLQVDRRRPQNPTVTRTKSMIHPNFMPSSDSPSCGLLTGLYDWNRDCWEPYARFITGLTLLDVGDYDGTVLYDPAMTPTNTVTFACTGGDDVHFGLLRRSGMFGDDSPVVMTVPMAGDSALDANFIVGATLHEFLCIGCTHGYFRLETLAYDWFKEFLDELKTDPEDPEAYAAFRDRFDLKPWQNVEGRLAELEVSIKPELTFQTTRN